MVIFTPCNQVKIQDVATVRLNFHGQRFEIACYKNKVLDWRSGVKCDINDVVQSDLIFTNVSKGQVANKNQLEKCFPSSSNHEIISIILEKGELQISHKERHESLQSKFKDVVTILHEMCINPQTGYPLTRTMVEESLKKCGFSCKLEESTKKQALKAFALLKKENPNSISRAQIRLKILFPQQVTEDVKQFIESLDSIIENTTQNDKTSNLNSITFTCCPSHYRCLEIFISKLNPPGTLQIVNHHVNERQTNEIKLKNLEMPAPAFDYPNLETPKNPKYRQSEPSPVKDKLIHCSTCFVSFQTTGLFRDHCKTQWHTFNLKRKYKGMGPISNEMYEEISTDIANGFLAVDS